MTKVGMDVGLFLLEMPVLGIDSFFSRGGTNIFSFSAAGDRFSSYQFSIHVCLSIKST